MIKPLALTACLLIVNSELYAQFSAERKLNEGVYHLTGNLLFDSTPVSAGDSAEFTVKSLFFDERKKPLKAALYSALIPGLGELYSESYWTAAVFFTAEVLLLSTSIYYEDLANRKEEEFEALANDPEKGWFVDKYAIYLIDYNAGTTLSNSLKAAMGESYQVIGTPGNRSWWSLLNELERESTFSNGQKFSHALPGYNSQQYYELIGKYGQFSPGWWDHNTTDGLNPSVAFLAYRDMRTKANEIHDLASNLMIGVFLNHIGSAVNAALQANWYNKNAHVSLRQQSFLMKNTYVADITINF